jgi:hypothetical protein
VQLGHQQLTGLGVLQPVEQPAQDAGGRRHHAAAAAGVHALGEDVDPDPRDEVAPQGRRRPQPFVVAAERVEADDQAGRADAVGEVLDVVGQVGAAALLAALDQHDAAAVRPAGPLHGLDGGERGEHGVPVVGAAPAVEAALDLHRLPWAEAVPPAVHGRLLVEVAVEQDGVVGCDVAGPGPERGDLQPQHRRPVGEADHVDGQPGHVPGLAPCPGQLDRPIHVTGLGPTGVVRLGDVRDPDVLGERREDLVLPHLVGERAERRLVDRHAGECRTTATRTGGRCPMGQLPVTCRTSSGSATWSPRRPPARTRGGSRCGSGCR